MYDLASPEQEILWAAEQGNLGLVKTLVSKQSNLVNIHDNDGYTALHRACYSNHLPIVDVSIMHIDILFYNLIFYYYSFY